VPAETIDLRAAAQQLGVHYQTAYRWVRSGQLRSTRVMGAYRLDRDAVARFAERRARPTRPRAGRSRASLVACGDRMFGYLAAGEERRARQLVRTLVGDGVSVTMAVQEVLVPALRRIGDEWLAGRLDVGAEHRASAIAERILGEHHPNPRGRRRGVAVVAALAGDRHALATTLAAVALREDNWSVQHLGADLPAAELLRFCQRQRVDLVVLTVTTTGGRAAATRAAQRLEDLGLRVLVGGPGRSLDELLRLADHAPSPPATGGGSRAAMSASGRRDA
jgi:excisionase family DNA binding protein